MEEAKKNRKRPKPVDSSADETDPEADGGQATDAESSADEEQQEEAAPEPKWQKPKRPTRPTAPAKPQT